MMRNAAMREPLEGLAAETGGEALINRMSLVDDLQEMAQGLSSPAPNTAQRRAAVEPA